MEPKWWTRIEREPLEAEPEPEAVLDAAAT